MSRKMMYFLWCVLMVFLCIGCARSDTEFEKIEDIDYTVLGHDEWPESLSNILEEKKEQPFEMTYAEGDFLYICVGYGAKDNSGYSIQVEDCYLAEECIYVNTTLIGPQTDTADNDVTSYPVIVLKTEYIDKTVVFD